MIKDSIYKALISIINYGNFIEGKTDYVDSNTDFELLNAVYTGFLYTMLFEDYFDPDTETTILTDEFTELLITMIATKTPDGYTFGTPGVNLGYETKEKALVRIRNKMAHGDFYVKEGNIIFEEQGAEGIINLTRFKDVLSLLEHDGDEYKKCTPNSRDLYINKNKTINPIDKTNIDKISRKIYQFRIIDEPTPLHVRNTEYTQAVDTIINGMSTFIDENKNLPIEKYKDMFYKLVSIFKPIIPMNVKCDIVPLTDIPEYKAVKTKFLYRNKAYKNMGVSLGINSQIVLLTNMAYGMKEEKRNTIKRGTILNNAIIEVLKENPTLDRDKIINAAQGKLIKSAEVNIEDIVLTSYLIGFYAIFQYGLETSLTKAYNRGVYEIYEGTKFDFSKLDVSILESDNRVKIIPAPNLDYSEDKLDELGSLRAKLNRLEEGLKNAIRKNGEDSETVIKLKSKADKALRDYQVHSMLHLCDLNAYSKFCKDFDYDKYANNLDIIYHVRNAIAHGNVRVVSYGKDILDTVLHIISRRKGRTGNIVYDKEISIRDFVKIFSLDNVQLLHDFLVNNINDEKLVEKNYIAKVVKRHI